MFRKIALNAIGAFLLTVLSGSNIVGQSSGLQERLAQIKQASAENKQALAAYTWQEQQTVSIKGEVKKQELFLVQLGPDGKPIKTPINDQSASSDSGRSRGLKHRIVEKKKEEFQQYAQQIGDLARSYTQPNPQLLQQAYQSGNLLLGPAGNGNGIRFVIHSYLKPGDSVTLVFDTATKKMESTQVSSYLDTPSDAVTVSAEFAELPDGTNHVSSMTVNGVSKQLTVAIQNLNYQKM